MPPIPTNIATTKLKIPQARVLRALMPNANGERPIYSRFVLAETAGFTPTTGTINRVLHGIPQGSSSGEPHLGVLDLKYVTKMMLDIDGRMEDNYRITDLGVKAYNDFLASGGVIPATRDAKACTNARYNKT